MKATRFFLLLVVLVCCYPLVTCSAETNVLDRILAVPGDGTKVNVALKSYSPGETVKMKIVEKPTSATQEYVEGFSGTLNLGFKKPLILVSGGAARFDASLIMDAMSPRGGGYSLSTDPGKKVLIEGEFCVDESLKVNPSGYKGEWDGEKEGATHSIIGKLKLFDYEFDSDSRNPLKFRMTRNGYLYIGGKGTVKDNKTGKSSVYKGE